jgi:hypothetical protein
MSASGFLGSFERGPGVADSRFGPQPIREYVWREGWTHGEFAELSGVRPYAHVTQAMAGKCPPSPALRKAAVELLGMPLQVLFTSEAIATTYRPKRNRTPRRMPATGGAR